MSRSKRRTGFRGRSAPLARVTAILIAVLAAYAYWTIAIPVGGGKERVIEIPLGQSARGVAATLEREGLIRSRAAFLAYAYVTRRHDRLQAGGHKLAPTMSAAEILDALCRGTRRTWRWLTIPEGYTLRQIAEVVEATDLATKDDLLRSASANHLPGFPLPKTGVEGYLFPDTYRVAYDAGAEDIVAQMLRGFDEVVWQGLFHRRPAYRGRSLHDIITLASLVEAEARHDRERAAIAGVLMNRLRLGQRLECDATVQYALGADRKQRLLYKDLKIESEYNTYLHQGLPPGPICSPGVASIRAAMEPARVPYLYYVAKSDGSHVFSRTFAEHTAAIARIRQGARR